LDLSQWFRCRFIEQVHDIGLVIEAEVHDTTEILIVRAVTMIGLRLRAAGFRFRIVAWNKHGLVIGFAMAV
jgi:hypothetical protein